MRAILPILLFGFVLSCNDKAPGICGVDDPANDLPWLKALIDLKKTEGDEEYRVYSYIMQAELDGNVIFFDGSCCPNCLFLVQYYDCSGNKLNVDFKQLKNSKLVWKHENSLCLFP